MAHSTPQEDSARNLLAYLAWVGEMFGCSLEWDGVIGRMAVGVPLPELNWVLNASAIALDEMGAVERTLAFYDQRKLPFSWYPFGDGYQEVLMEKLSACGGRIQMDLICMAKNLDGKTEEAEGLPQGVSISETINLQDLDDWSHATAEGFGYPDEVRESFGNLAAQFCLPGPDHRVYLARVDNQPAGTALLFRSGRVAGLYFVSVMPPFHRRGLGNALTRRALLDARQAGCRIAILQSNQMSKDLYRQLGFQPIEKMGMISFEHQQSS